MDCIQSNDPFFCALILFSFVTLNIYINFIFIIRFFSIHCYTDKYSKFGSQVSAVRIFCS